jgi:multicomponent Na+:H+ antiporter subunit D
MTIDRLVELATTINPGVFLILAAIPASFATGSVVRVLALIGGPLLALAVMLYPPVAGVEVARGTFLGFDIAVYRPDSLSLIFGLGFVIAALLGGIFALHRVDRMQDASGLLYAGSAMGAVFSGGLVSLVVFWELTAIASAVLVFAGRTRKSYSAGMRYLVIQMISGVLMMTGAAMLGIEAGSFLIADLGSPQDGVLVGLFNLDLPGAWLILIGVGIKAGFPLAHNWLTDAYPNATETGAVTLSPYTTTLAVYVLARGFAGTEWLVWVGAAMTIYPVFFAVMENDLRKVLSYSTNNQIGFMVVAVGIGTPLALNGAAAHAVAHIVFKTLLFMAMGAVMLRTGTTKATELGGLHRTMPYTTLFCLVGAASISALPYLAGFASKSMIMSAVHNTPGLFAVWLMLLFASAGVLEHSGIKIPFFAFFSHDSGKRPKEAPFNMLLAMGLASGLCIAIGSSPAWFYALLPYRDQALEYLAQDLFTQAHLLEQFQLLCFAVLAFMVLKWMKLYPPEKRGVIIDVEWLWRKGAPAVLEPAGRLAAASVVGANRGGEWMRRRIIAGARQAFDPTGLVARKVPLAATAVCALGLLAIVLIAVLF